MFAYYGPSEVSQQLLFAWTRAVVKRIDPVSYHLAKMFHRTVTYADADAYAHTRVYFATTYERNLMIRYDNVYGP